MRKKKPRPRRSFTPEFEAEIVELCQRGDRSIGQVAKDFDLAETAVRQWVRRAEVDTGQRDGFTSRPQRALHHLEFGTRSQRFRDCSVAWVVPPDRRHVTPHQVSRPAGRAPRDDF
ncbi:transposase [Nonomuraea angiospora]|uniref:transposase n=1 Tax=Nonomuraea angiospora TaxID=46172 RepID=UPI00344F54D5